MSSAARTRNASDLRLLVSVQKVSRWEPFDARRQSLSVRGRPWQSGHGRVQQLGKRPAVFGGDIDVHGPTGPQPVFADQRQVIGEHRRIAPAGTAARLLVKSRCCGDLGHPPGDGQPWRFRARGRPLQAAWPGSTRSQGAAADLRNDRRGGRPWCRRGQPHEKSAAVGRAGPRIDNHERCDLRIGQRHILTSIV